jgi:hypothetical protein
MPNFFPNITDEILSRNLSKQNKFADAAVKKEIHG